MASLRDILFGKKALQKAAGTDKPPTPPSQPAGLDIAKMAQEQANRQLPPKSAPKGGLTESIKKVKK